MFQWIIEMEVEWKVKPTVFTVFFSLKIYDNIIIKKKSTSETNIKF